ncbi:MAG: PadR family transcriptional regulator [Hyphomonadaceae bacterium]|nr:PadR family transcriptional regulator [Hyphomonadaceae bacterium]
MRMHGSGRGWRERVEAHRGWGGGRHGGGMGGGGWGRHRGRMFDQGDLRLITLKLIEEKPRHGYDIIKAIEESLGGAYAPSPGVVYPTLALLVDEGHVSVSEEGGKKLHTITDAGRKFLADNAATIEGVNRRLDAARERFGAGPPPQIVRAMENLRMALRLKLERGPLPQDKVAAIAAALDFAAQQVEQS